MSWHEYEHDYRVYEGERMSRGCLVMVRYKHDDGDSMTTPLDARNDIINHSPDGFEWGYAGSGPAQLALAIIADLLRNPECLKRLNETIDKSWHLTAEAWASRLHQQFKAALIAWIQTDTWEFDERTLMGILTVMVRSL